MAENARAWPNLIYGGATIYDGDQLQTQGSETLLARLGSGQMMLRENSSAIVRSASQGLSAELESGSLAVSWSDGQSFQVLADGATIRPLNAQPASAQITRLNERELIITSTRGTLAVSIGGEVKTIEPGTSYRMEAEAGELGAGQHPSIAQKAGRSHFLQIAVIGAGLILVLAIIRALESGDRLIVSTADLTPVCLQALGDF